MRRNELNLIRVIHYTALVLAMLLLPALRTRTA